MQHGSWLGPRDLLGSSAHQESYLDAGGDLVDHLLAAQLHAFHLGGLPAGAYPGGANVGGGIAAATLRLGSASVAQASPSSTTDEESPQQVDLLVSSNLLTQLHMGTGLAHSAQLPSSALPSALPAPPHPQHQHQQLALYLKRQLQPLSQVHPQQHIQPPSNHLQQHPHKPLQRQAPANKRHGAGGRRNEEKVRRTVYISDIAECVSEAQLAMFFEDCGHLVDCRVCGDPNSSMRFAFIEFMAVESVHKALCKNGALLGDHPIRVSPSKTAIVPVNNTYLPRSSEERELVARTVFVGSIDRVVQREQLREFFENLCGPVSKIRLLGDSQHNSKIAFVEFATAESAKDALKLSGALLGTLPLRISPSKTPVRGDSRGPQEGGSAAAAIVPAGPASHAALNPALLMAVTGLQMYPTLH